VLSQSRRTRAHDPYTRSANGLFIRQRDAYFLQNDSILTGTYLMLLYELQISQEDSSLPREELIKVLNQKLKAEQQRVLDDEEARIIFIKDYLDLVAQSEPQTKHFNNVGYLVATFIIALPITIILLTYLLN
jgi:hypothetical protein